MLSSIELLGFVRINEERDEFLQTYRHLRGAVKTIRVPGKRSLLLLAWLQLCALDEERIVRHFTKHLLPGGVRPGPLIKRCRKALAKFHLAMFGDSLKEHDFLLLALTLMTQFFLEDAVGLAVASQAGRNGIASLLKDESWSHVRIPRTLRSANDEGTTQLLLSWIERHALRVSDRGRLTEEELLLHVAATGSDGRDVRSKASLFRRLRNAVHMRGVDHEGEARVVVKASSRVIRSKAGQPRRWKLDAVIELLERNSELYKKVKEGAPPFNANHWRVLRAFLRQRDRNYKEVARALRPALSERAVYRHLHRCAQKLADELGLKAPPSQSPTE